MLSVFLEEFIAGDELDFSGQQSLCSSLIYDAVYGTLAAIKAFHQLFDGGGLFVQPVQFGGFGRADDAGGLFEDGLVGMSLFVAQESVSDSFVCAAGLSCNPVYYLMA